MKSNDLNDFSKEKSPRSSTYDLSHSNLLTARFGELTPFFHRETLRGDRFRFSNDMTIRTYTLGSPLLSPVRVHKDYYYVPNLALLPNFWKYIEVNPKFGDDVDARRWNSILSIRQLLEAYSSMLQSIVSVQQTNVYDVIVFKSLLFFRNTFGKGSLLHYLGYVLPDTNGEYDSIMSSIDSLLSSGLRSSSIVFLSSDDSSSYTMETSDKSSRCGLWDYLSEVSDFSFPGTVFKDMSYVNVLESIIIFLENYIFQLSSDKFLWNVRDLLAYKAIVYHFFTSDDVDNVFSCERWLDTYEAIAEDVLGSSYPSLELNGKSYHCDCFSGEVFDSLISYLSNSLTPATADKVSSVLSLFNDLFSFSHSLRYGDRFVGCRKQPLAVGNVEVSVVDNAVNVVDITKNIQMQRFLNAVNRVPQKLKDYAAGIFGEVSSDDSPSSPKWLVSSVQNLNNPEVDNTADNQGHQTSYLEDRTSKYEFESEFRGNGVVIGILSFDVIGSYPSCSPAEHRAQSRFDYFIPELQHIGDEPVYAVDYDVNVTNVDKVFGYQVRNSEYKFAQNEVHGGFLSSNTQLDSWYFNNYLGFPANNISSEFIRHYPWQFDKFYTLTGVNLENRFHFIVRSVNNLSAERNMVRKPTIL